MFIQNKRYVTLLVTTLFAVAPYCVHADSGLSVNTDLFTRLQSLLSSLAHELATIGTTMQRSSHAQLAAAASAVGTGVGSCGTLATNGSLTPNQSVVSCNGAYTLIFQGDGNVVLYQTSKLGQSGAPWSTQTNGQTATLFAMQGDGNLVLYNGSTALWGSRSQPGSTYGRAGHLIVGDNGILTVFANDNGAALWSSVPGSLATFATVVVPTSPTGLSASCDSSTHIATFSWSPSTDATSYKIHLQDAQSGGTGDFAPTSPKQSVTGLYGSYNWNVSACNSAGCSSAASGSTISCVPIPTATVTADNASISVGQSTTIRATFTAGAGDSLLNNGITGGLSTTNPVTLVSSGPAWGTTVQSSLSYVFTPSAPGTYYFYSNTQTNDYPSWGVATVPRVMVTVSPSAMVSQPVPSFPTNKTDFYTALYSCILNRQPDSAGLNGWVNSSPGLTLSSVYQAWFDSAEYLGRHTSNELFVAQLYSCILFRSADQGGYNGYVQALQNNTLTRDAAVQAVLSSNEFTTNPGLRLSTATGLPIANPTGTITASASSILVGQSTTITLSGTAAPGDTLYYLYINQSLNGAAQTNVVYTTTSPNVYTFTPKTAGTYTFYGWAYSAKLGTWYQIPGASVTVTVTTVPLQTVDNLNKNDPYTWLLKSVCVDANNRVLVGVDPYGGCPVGSTIRKQKLDDPIPYRNQGETYTVFRDVLTPIRLVDGSTAALVAFDWSPLHQYNLYTGSDGYDVFGVKDGWVSGIETQDGGGYGQVFMQSNCTLGYGWILFPSTNFLSGGTANINYLGNHWLKDAQNFPGSCSWNNPSPILTTWKYIPNFSFGGINGTPTKTMDTLVSYDGNEGHIEVFYFTREYGMTRWEAYQPVSQGYAADTSDCSGPSSMTYKGVNFTRTACVDPLKIVTPPGPVGPVWPAESINLLQHSHFDTSGDGDWTGVGLTGIWYRGGNSSEGNLINWMWRNSRATPDLVGSSIGPSYIATNCAGTCTGQYVQEIYQEVPISKFTSGSTYAYGANLRTEGGQGDMMITLQEIDKTHNKVLWQDSFKGTVVQDNGPDQDPNQPNSVYLSSKFVSKTVQIPVISGATVIRYYFTPLTTNVTFDILNGWFAPWPQGSPTPYGSL